MKILIVGMVISFALSAGLAFAADSGSPGDHGKHPCQAVRAACEAAGFAKGGHKSGGKGLYVDCMQKLFKGEAVPGVSVDSATLQACQSKKEKRHSK